MTSVSTFACLQMLALRDVSPALNCQLHVHRARMAVHFSAGRALENLGSRDRIGQYCSASRDGHQIHPLRVTRIDSVKINPSLVMMRECIRAPPRRGRYWEIHPRRPISRDPRDFPRAKPEGNLEGRGKSERFSEAVGFAPRDPRDFPRAKPEGNPEGRGVQNPRPRKISRAEGMDFPIPPESWWSTDILSSLPGKD